VLQYISFGVSIAHDVPDYQSALVVVSQLDS